MSTEKFLYKKPYLNNEQHIELLKSRGLDLGDINNIKFCLNYIGYHYLSTYFKSFQHNDNGEEKDNFFSNTKFDDILELYNFDKELKTILFEILNELEIGMKNIYCIYIGGIDDDSKKYQYDDSKKYQYDDFEVNINTIKYIDNNLYKKQYENSFFDGIIEDQKNQKNPIICEFNQKYINRYPPQRKLIESLSFGLFINIFKNTKDEHIYNIIKKYLTNKKIKITDKDLLFTLEISRILRNQIAHCGRIRNINFPRKIPKTYRDFITEYRKNIPNYEGKEIYIGNNNIFSYIIIITILYKKISNGNNVFLIKLKELLHKYENLLPIKQTNQDWILYINLLDKIYGDL